MISICQILMNGNLWTRLISCCFWFWYELCLFHMQDGCAVVCLPHSCCQLGSKMLFAQFNCKMPALFPDHLLFMIQHYYPPCVAEEKGECISSFLCFSTRIYFTSALSLSFLSTGLLCVFIVTSKWPSSPCSLHNPTPTFSLGTSNGGGGGGYTYFPGSNTIPDMLSGCQILMETQQQENFTTNLFGPHRY